MRLWLMILSSLLLVVGIGNAERISSKFTPIKTFSDDRGVKILNDNFDRINQFGVVASSFNFSVPTGRSSVTVTLATPQTDIDYGIYVQTSWSKGASVLSKSATGFMVLFDTATANAKMDYTIVR